jgi:hypothetical protein
LAEPSLHVATICYGGQAAAGYLRSALALEAACAARGLPMRLELGGGEALIGRARAGMMTQFLAGQASHLLFADADTDFTADDVFALLDSGSDVAVREPGLLLVSREAATRIAGAHPELAASLRDVRGAGAAPSVMVFDSLIEPETRRYLSDIESFCSRWRGLGGEVFHGRAA